MRKLSAELVQELVKWYTSQDEPPRLDEAAKQFDISRDSARRYLKRNGVQLRPVGPRSGVKRGPYKKYIDRPDRFCPCGQKLQSSDYRFCSKVCSKKYSLTGKTYGARITKICLGCGEEFSRPASYGFRRYCSNRCAHKEQKKGWGKTGVVVPDGILILRSMYELRFVACCERYGIRWRSYDGPDLETSVGTYRPDFIVNDVVVEVKGWYENDAVVKYEESIAGDVTLVLLTQELLVRCEESKQEFEKIIT